MAAGTLQQNDIIERKNQSLLEAMRSLLFGAQLPTYLWEEAMRTANYLSNQNPTRALHQMILHEKFTGQKPTLSHLRQFGCTAYLHV